MKRNKDELVALQIGDTNWQSQYKITPTILWVHLTPEDIETFDFSEYSPFDIVFLEKPLTNAQEKCVMKKIKPYRCLSTVVQSEVFTRLKMIQHLSLKDIQTTLDNLENQYFNIVGGTKLHLDTIEVDPQFSGSIQYNGHIQAILQGDFGQELTDILVWRKAMGLLPKRAIEFWLEYEIEGDINISLHIDEIIPRQEDKIARSFDFNLDQLQETIVIERNVGYEYYVASLRAQGQGTLKIGNLHYGESRNGIGSFIVGGKRIHDTKRDEFITYFHPGDLKPPLNIYFSGYRTLEGFEGERMMTRFGAPYLLFGDPRLEGGGFYLGSEEFEQKIIQTITETLDWLGFKRSDLILSGLSMGTFGALYYGLQLQPHAIIVGKPLISLGNVAQNETIFRPGGFATSLDLLKKNYGQLDKDAIEAMNNRFWNLFEKTKFNGTKIASAYMYQDDYDKTAYDDLLDHKKDKDIMVYGKGIEGRHNDNTTGVVQWFIGQYKEILKNDFGREKA